MMRVLFAPDWRLGSPYQQLLADGLQRHGVNVDFLEGYKRILPLTRSLAKRQVDLLHLHWPEAYYPRKNDGFDWFRCARFPIDLTGATRRCVLVATAHNYFPHNRANESFARRNIRSVHGNASVVLAHSNVAKQRLVDSLKVPAEKVRVIPHGDLSVALGRPLPISEARCALGLGAEKIALMFGAVEPYKGLEEVIAWWQHSQPDIRLAIIGKPISLEYGSQIAQQVSNAKNIMHRLDWLPDEKLRLWLSAADVVVFNYREIFTSGAASLARSCGIPILLPSRLDAICLMEPTPYVRRFTSFATDFGKHLCAALSVPSDFAAGKCWREACNWDKVAALTADAYRYAMNES